MKNKLLAIALLLAPSLIHAHVVDLTPGGFRSGEPLPPIVERWFNNVYGISIVYAGNAHIDENQVVTWEPMPVNGSNTNVSPTGVSDFISWQLPSGLALSYIVTGYYDFVRNVSTFNLYMVTPNSYYVGYGSVNVDNQNAAQGIAFYTAILAPHPGLSFQRPKDVYKTLLDHTLMRK